MDLDTGIREQGRNLFYHTKQGKKRFCYYKMSEGILKKEHLVAKLLANGYLNCFYYLYNKNNCNTDLVGLLRETRVNTCKVHGTGLGI